MKGVMYIIPKNSRRGTRWSDNQTKEIWSRRAGSKLTGWSTGKYAKRRTHKIERQEGKQDAAS